MDIYQTGDHTGPLQILPILRHGAGQNLAEAAPLHPERTGHEIQSIEDQRIFVQHKKPPFFLWFHFITSRPRRKEKAFRLIVKILRC